jgi:hypothetical protein
MARPLTTSFVLAGLTLATACSPQIGDATPGLADDDDEYARDGEDAGPADAAPAPDARPPCVEGDARVEDPETGTCYFLVLAKATWADARDACIAAGAHLATSASLAENQLFSSIAPTTAGSGNEDVWIGATDAAVEGTFAWENGEPFTFANWRSGEPNDGDTNGEDCAIIEGDTGGLWDDRDCATNLFPSMCERDG